MIRRLKHWLNCLGKALIAGAVARHNHDDSTDARPVAGVRTLFDEVQTRWPSASPEAIDELLWLTPYPAGSRASVVASLDRMRDQYGPNIADAINGEYNDFDQTWQRERHKYE